MGGPVIAAAPSEAIEVEAPFLARIRLRALRRVVWLRRLWAASRTHADDSLVIGHGEVDRMLAEPLSMAEAEAVFNASDPHALELGDAVFRADQAFADDPVWHAFRTRLGLSQQDLDLLSLAVAAELRPELVRLYGYLQDDVEARLPSAALAASLFEWPPDELVGAGSGLLDWALARRVEHPSSTAAAAGWAADPLVVATAVGAQPVLPPGTTLLQPGDAPATCLYRTELAGMARFIGAVRSRSEAPIELELVGIRGSGRGVLAWQLAAAHGRKLLVADASEAEADDDPLRVARTARLTGALLYIRVADGADPAVWKAARGRVEVTALGVTVASASDGTAPTASYRLPLLTQGARLGLWHELTDASAPDSVAELLLTPGEIAAAARAAAIGPEAAEEACRRQIEIRPGELLSPMPCPYAWSDIVLPDHLRRHLEEFEQQARWRWEVYEGWGFERLVPLGRGVTALFAGPSGTGKTMAAQVLARSLGLDLYRIDLAGVVNKYIGETEKRLRQVFDAFERAPALALFDEADALFGRRAQVKDAHDRFANIEIDYLLQRMERFEGIAVLATNRKEDLDRAFLRRLRFVIDFLRPGRDERLAIWRLALAEHSPSGEPLLDGIDFEQLAERLPLTGAGIKTAALGAAFLARGESRRIRMEDVLAAAKRELAKQGAELRPGDWQEQA